MTRRNEHGELCQYLSYLDVLLILHANGLLETDVYYKETNSHDYLDFYSHHPRHTKENIPYNLAKRIIVFCSDDKRVDIRLKELKQWLLQCNYPSRLIDQKFHNAKLQGPANKPQSDNSVIPLVSTFYSNYNVENVCKTANSLLKSVKSPRLRTVFEDCKVICSYRQPPNLLRQFTSASFQSTPTSIVEKVPGFYKCQGKRCELCTLGYIKECNYFVTSNGFKWEIKTHINCNSRNVLYFLKCTSCNDTTYTGKTNNLRLRMNNHRSSAKNGTGSDIFDNHVHECRKGLKIGLDIQPLFHIYAFMTVKDKSLLLAYEQFLHSKKFDTMN